MRLYNHSSGYGLISILFHWLIASGIIFLLVVGEFILEKIHYADPVSQFWMRVHELVGILVFFLAVGQLIWAWWSPFPHLPSYVKSWERLVAKAVHILLLILPILLPVTGYLSISTVFRIDHDWAEWLEELHETLAHVTIGLVILHISAALKHHFWNKDSILVRMLGEEIIKGEVGNEPQN
ncbi:MAG: cytochrome b/b6 domain-containing protein [Gammaproteobacteria bacterium]|nr:cytochrome b/b6 domain-containing protein [Gammaproteobacteria bacterium]